MTFQPGEEKFQGDLIDVYNYLIGRSWEGGAKFSSVVPRDRTRGNDKK